MATAKGINGQQAAQQNLDKFRVWVATQSDEDFKQITRDGNLNRSQLAMEVGCGKSALTQNPNLKRELKALEDDLRKRNILPQLKDSDKKIDNKAKEYDSSDSPKRLNSKRLSLLEAENIELKSVIKGLKNQLERYGELTKTISEMGFMPR
ncbi:VPA1267 family protein [Colwellia psychrerythraea]|uniref:Uncharacterized protein n=1 Tax=Colwellia psychrerythraea TaxID=28229 RepID=A0A099K9N7_COLPS|nr:VPA1267 family protein [Colwellia psychrerythraea]KGJ86985.1 hypothetical protein ND2E_0392 [Colwellia psychrerythraea]